MNNNPLRKQWENESFADFKKRTDYISANLICANSAEIKMYKNRSLGGMLDKFPLGDKFYKSDSNAYESLSEKLASILLSCSNLATDTYVSYDLVPLMIDNEYRVGCESLNFKTEYPFEMILFYAQSQESNRSQSHQKELFRRLHQTGDLAEKFQLLLDFIVFKTAVSELLIKERLLTMMAFDLLILNRDRHYGNLIILEAFGSDKINPIPLFDYGNSVIGGINSPEIIKTYFPKASSMEEIFNTIRNQRDRMFNEPFYQLGEFTKTQNFFLYFDYNQLLDKLATFQKEQLLYHPSEVGLSTQFLLLCLRQTEGTLWKRL